LSTRIKFCGFVREQDAIEAARLGVDAIGLVFYSKSSRYIEPHAAKSLREKLPSSVQIVGLFVNESAQQIEQIHKLVGLDVLQFHGDETLDQIYAVTGRLKLPYWRAARIRQASDLLNCYKTYIDAKAILLDSYSPQYGGSGEVFDWLLIDQSALKSDRLIVSGGLDAQSVGEAIKLFKPMAVDVSSGIQVTGNPREKDFVKMQQFVDAVKAADSI
jgi:phosphoribosylanthranilate isomerase